MLIDFEEKRREKQFERRIDEVEKNVQLGGHELFDKWMEKEEASLTDKRIAECRSYIDFLKSIEVDPSGVFEDVIFFDPDSFMHDYKVDWLESIEASITYYSVLRQYDKPKYDLVLLNHPFIGFV